ncbi:MAG: hypothetical protein ACXQS8_08420 [Candidatus Helarchaeales archaeon]
MIDLGQDIVKAVFIFNKKNGRPFIRYIKNKQDFDVESFLVIGFLTAIIKFAREVGRTDLKVIDMEDLRFIFTEKNDVVFTAITGTTVNPIDLLFKIKTIESIFLNEFTPKELSDSRLELEYFNKFIPVVDEIIHGDVRYIRSEEKEKVKKQLLKFKEKNEFIMGMALFSFTGEILLDLFQVEEHRKSSRILFNAIFGTRLTGISRFCIEFVFTKKFAIFMKRIEEETLIVLIGPDQDTLIKNESKINDLTKKIGKIISKPPNLLSRVKK